MLKKKKNRKKRLLKINYESYKKNEIQFNNKSTIRYKKLYHLEFSL